MLAEAKKINLSLTALGICIKALTDGSQHVPFRDSKLTFFLKDALGGNSKTTLIVTASKQMFHLDEAVQTLKFAQRAKRIMNKTAANVLRSPKEMEELIKRLKIEVSTLKGQLLDLGVAPRAPNKNDVMADAALQTPAKDEQAMLSGAGYDPKSKRLQSTTNKDQIKAAMEAGDTSVSTEDTSLFDQIEKVSDT